MLFVGLTGGIATGKSTAAEVFRNRGIPVIDADEIARLVVQPGKKAYDQIRRAFGDEFFDEETGELQRQKLGNYIFGNVERRKKLNAIVHPEIRTEMIKRAFWCFLRGFRFVVMDVPLLFEGPMHKIMQKIVVVYCDPETQIERLMLRDSLSESEAQARIQAQMPIEEKRKRATHPVDNNGDIEATKKRINEIIDELEVSWQPFFIRAGLLTALIALFLPVIKFIF